MELSKHIQTLLQTYNFHNYQKLFFDCIVSFFKEEDAQVHNTLCRITKYDDPAIQPYFEKFQKDETMLSIAFYEIAYDFIVPLAEKVYDDLFHIVLSDKEETIKKSILNEAYVSLYHYNLGIDSVWNYYIRLKYTKKMQQYYYNSISNDFQDIFFKTIDKLVYKIEYDFAHLLDQKLVESVKNQNDIKHQDLILESYRERDLLNIKESGKAKSSEGKIQIWKKKEGDLIELVTALHLTRSVGTNSGVIPKQQLANLLTDIFGMERIKPQTFADRDSKNLRRKIQPAKFLTDLKEKYELAAKQRNSK